MQLGARAAGVHGRSRDHPRRRIQEVPGSRRARPLQLGQRAHVLRAQSHGRRTRSPARRRRTPRRRHRHRDGGGDGHQKTRRGQDTLRSCPRRQA